MLENKAQNPESGRVVLAVGNMTVDCIPVVLIAPPSARRWHVSIPLVIWVSDSWISHRFFSLIHLLTSLPFS
ncbi:MAG: hypothetical protein V7K78_15740 [Nostoc sp.]